MADETPAYEMVLKSDTKRTELLAESERLKAELENNGNTDLIDRLNEVSWLNLIDHFWIRLTDRKQLVFIVVFKK